jgi:phosphatidylglycerophosphate synthase
MRAFESTATGQTLRQELTMSELGTGTARRDSSVAAALSVVLCAALAGFAGSALVPSLAAVATVAGIAVVVAAGAAVTARAGGWSGPADRVTLARTVLIGGCATCTVLILAGALSPRPWLLLVLLVPALALDAVDGPVARRTGTATPAGARFDMEMDAALLMILSVAAIASLGWWVLAIGGMRYAYVAAAQFRPQLARPLAFSQFRRQVAAVQGITLAAALSPVFSLPVARVAVALALVLLVISFGRDVIAQERGDDSRLAAIDGSGSAAIDNRSRAR